MAPEPEFREALEATRRAARDLTVATAHLTKRLAEKAEVAMKDPSGSAKQAVDKVAKGLNHLVDDLDRLLKDL